VIGSVRTTNEENYLLQKFARMVLRTNSVDHHRTADFPALAAAFSKAPAGGGRATSATATMREVFTAPAILLIGSNSTDEHPLLAYNIRNNVRLHKARLYVVNSSPIKLRRQATVFAQVAEENGEAAFVHFLAGNDAAPSGLSAGDTTAEQLAGLRDKLRGEQELVVAFGADLRGTAIAELVRTLPKAKFICLGDYANSRGAADMGLYPDLLPGYTPLSDAARFATEWGAEIPQQPGLNILQMAEAARVGKLKALYCVGANPIARYQMDPYGFAQTFVVAQDLFLTETAMLAEVVLPAASAYEKDGTFSNTCGDLQLVSKAGDLAGTRSDLEIIVRLADHMGFDVRKLVPFDATGRGAGVHADMGQSRGAQSGEADQHAVWLEAQGLEPKLSPFDPAAVLDEIQRLVSGYDFSRLNLRAGNDQHVTSLEVRVDAGDSPARTAESAVSTQTRGALQDSELIMPSRDTLFSGGTLGRYSDALQSVMEAHKTEPAEQEVPA